MKQHNNIKKENTGIGWPGKTGVILAMLLLFSLSVFADEPYTASIDKVEKDHMHIFTAIFENYLDETMEAQYTMELIRVRHDASGRSLTTQKGAFQAGAGEKTSLSQVSVNVSEGDSYVIILKIYTENKLLCRDSIWAGPPFETMNTNP